MEIIFSSALIILGLIVFETVASIDNAVINAEVLSTMGAKARRWFLTWGIFFAVFVARGILPWLIVWLALPGVGFLESFTATFSNDPSVAAALQQSAPILLMGGGIFLLFLFLHWLFLESKSYGLRVEPFFERRGAWFFAVASVALMVLVWLALKQNPLIAFGAVVGSTVFFITHGFRQQAEAAEKSLMQSGMSDLSKIFYLEVIDLSFSIDGVLGAFAFTLSVPLILIGNGIGAVVVRQLTVANIERVKQYKLLKNGAMYSVFLLSVVMIGHGLGAHIPEWFSPLVTIVIIAYFLWKSRKLLAQDLAVAV